jgi:hypothetical protein
MQRPVNFIAAGENLRHKKNGAAWGRPVRLFQPKRP